MTRLHFCVEVVISGDFAFVLWAELHTAATFLLILLKRLTDQCLF